MSSLINEHGAFNRRKQGFVTKYAVKSLPDSRMKRKPHTAKGRKRMSNDLIRKLAQQTLGYGGMLNSTVCNTTTFYCLCPTVLQPVTGL